MLIADPADNHSSRSSCEGRLARPHRRAGDVRFHELAACARSRSTGPARRVHSGSHQCAVMPGSATRCLPRRDLQTCTDSPRIVLPRLAARYRRKRDPSKHTRRSGNRGTNILRTERVLANSRMRPNSLAEACAKAWRSTGVHGIASKLILNILICQTYGDRDVRLGQPSLLGEILCHCSR
jgi:hypothetical protein